MKQFLSFFILIGFLALINAQKGSQNDYALPTMTEADTPDLQTQQQSQTEPTVTISSQVLSITTDNTSNQQQQQQEETTGDSQVSQEIEDSKNSSENSSDDGSENGSDNGSDIGADNDSDMEGDENSSTKPCDGQQETFEPSENPTQQETNSTQSQNTTHEEPTTEDADSCDDEEETGGQTETEPENKVTQDTQSNSYEIPTPSESSFNNQNEPTQPSSESEHTETEAKSNTHSVPTPSPSSYEQTPNENESEHTETEAKSNTYSVPTPSPSSYEPTTEPCPSLPTPSKPSDCSTLVNITSSCPPDAIVSVENDAIYCHLPGQNGQMCSGTTDSEPAGNECPLKGDVAITNCHPYSPSFDATTGKCILKQDTTCQKISTGVYGCVIESSTPTPQPSNPTPAPSSMNSNQEEEEVESKSKQNKEAINTKHFSNNASSQTFSHSSFLTVLLITLFYI